jgi:beta-glucuronidase
MKNLKPVPAILAAVFLAASFAAAKPLSVEEQKAGNLKTSIDAANKYNSSRKYDVPKPFKIFDAGTDEWIDYTKYGEFHGVGTESYKYVVKDMPGLRAASGEGIWPNTQSVYKDPDYAKSAKKLKGNKWDYVNTDDYQLNFFKWAIEKDDPGVKLYYTAMALEKSGNIKHAVKAYYACFVFFPKSVGYTQWKTPWYVGAVCLDKIRYLTKMHPELGVRLEGADLVIKNRYDNDKNNDVFTVTPGKLVKAKAKDFDRKTLDLEKSGVKKVTGTGKVKLVQYNNGHFQLTVNDKPYLIRAICYSPTPVGLTPDNGSVNTDRDWTFADKNKNGIIDGPYEAWVDANRNGIQDADEKNVGDFSLMKEMGINTIRIYHYPNLNKELLKDGYEKYGFMYMVGNLLGMYGVDSGAEWYTGTDYTDNAQREKMLASVRKMVEEYKDEPYVLLWILGNENNYGTVGTQGVFAGTSNQAQKQPDAYYSFVNECVKLIKSIDPQQRPVAICNGDTYLMDKCAKNAPDLDIYGTNGYRGEQGFGPLWKDVWREYGKPVMITEFGCPAYAANWPAAKAENGQAAYHKGAWNDLEDNAAGIEGGVGNALGAVIFEWVDEWWKAGPPPEFDPYAHDVTTQWMGPFLDGGAYEEWFGLTSQGDGADSPFKRELRPAYFMYKDLWKKYRNDK